MEEYHHLVLTSRQLNAVRDVTLRAFCKLSVGADGFLLLRGILREIDQLKESIELKASSHGQEEYDRIESQLS